ncbi:MAG: hypothetical protein FWE46_04180 [Coriobacteriia bacterium]|nr:hypothetical protein [Coriobacteriia bacterium]MCL2537414.1 hypothetical protein [Coriobacteriia bacterium]
MTDPENFEYPNPQMSLVLRHFYDDNTDVLDRAGHEFFSYVQAMQERVPQDKIEQLFNEWFVYDFKLKTGKTPLETYLYRNPDELDERELDLMQQAGDSQFTSYFWIEDVDSATQTLTLRECDNAVIYKVRDATASQMIEGGAGLVAIRMIQIDNEWYFASDPISFMPVPALGQDGHNRPFIDVVKMHYGMPAGMEAADDMPEELEQVIDELDHLLGLDMLGDEGDGFGTPPPPHQN